MYFKLSQLIDINVIGKVGEMIVPCLLNYKRIFLVNNN